MFDSVEVCCESRRVEVVVCLPRLKREEGNRRFLWSLGAPPEPQGLPSWPFATPFLVGPISERLFPPMIAIVFLEKMNKDIDYGLRGASLSCQVGF